MRPFFKGCIINNDGFTRDSGIKKINAGYCDIISFGKFAISTPDLVERFKQGKEPNPLDFGTLFEGGPKGYTDYPTL